MSKNRILSRFPKKRPTLTPEYQAIYLKWMQINRGGAIKTTSLSTRLEQWMHRKMIADLPKYSSEDKIETLELGAGTLNHLDFDQRSNAYDVVEPSENLLSIAKNRSRVRQVFADLDHVSEGALYDRVISIAVLEHLEDLPGAVDQCIRHLKPGGVFRAAIPSEGTITWKMGWSLTTARAFRNLYQLDYEKLMQYEHINTAKEIVEVSRCYFKDVKLSSFGLCPSLSFYQFIEARNPIQPNPS